MAAAIKQEPRDSAWREICDLGLQQYVADLDAHSFCVIPPEIANPNGLADRMLEALLDIAEQRNGERPNMETGATHANQPNMLFGAKNDRFGRDELKDQTPAVAPNIPEASDSPFGDRMHSIFFEDEVFADALMNPSLLAIVTYMLGYSAVLSNMGCWMKGPNKSNFPLHTDAGGMPSPLPTMSYTAQCTYLLTDFTFENGATAIVPGSHKWCRNPVGRERDLSLNEQAIPIEGKAGSLVVWPGNAWHAAYNRTTPGLRVSVTVYFCRPFMRPLEDFIGRVPQEMIDKYGPRLAMVLQQGCVPGYASQGDRISGTARAEQVIDAFESEAGLGGLRDKDDQFH
ncbi:MAG: hypothetical protein CMQ33_13360 [Gammaproteobacteria bacterium]|jgi:hypothetical protein|nr:hypothetical protein [Gammaproteobacteria bacterium]